MFVVSRPVFYNWFYLCNKLCLYAMNRVSAAFLDCELSGEKEALEWVLKKLSTKPKKIFIFDCGGNLGQYSSMLLSTIDKLKIGNETEIHIFEPSSFCLDILANKFSDVANVNLHQTAVSNTNSNANLYYPWIGSAGASLSSNVATAQVVSGAFEVKSEQIETVTLDSFCEKNNIESIDYLKLDIEGYEIFALEGAQSMLANNKIAYIQIEIGAASLATKCMLFDIYNMLSIDYKFYLVLNHGLVEISEYKPDLECFHGASNFILENRALSSC